MINNSVAFPLLLSGPNADLESILEWHLIKGYVDIRDKEIAWCEELAEGLMYSCLRNLQKSGVNLVDKDTVGQLSFLAESIKSVVYYEKKI